MYHFGLKVGDNDDDLREVVSHLAKHGVPVLGASDHAITHSLYIADPDGNEIELYIDALPPRDMARRPFFNLRSHSALEAVGFSLIATPCAVVWDSEHRWSSTNQLARSPIRSKMQVYT